MLIPKEVIAKELEKIRRKKGIPIEKVASFLSLTEDEVKALGKGKLKTDNINAYLYHYLNFLGGSLENLYKNPAYKVQVPDIKTGKILGTETYWMAIDAYTTRFSNREELINDIRSKHLSATSDDIPNEDLWIFIDYPRENNWEIIDLIYSDNEELVRFIDENKIASFFNWSNPYVEKFNEEIKQVFRSTPNSQKACSAEYRRFASKNYWRFNKKMASMLPDWDKKYNDDVIIEGVQRYSSIRANTLCHMAYKADEPKIERSFQPFSEPSDKPLEEHKVIIKYI